MRLVGVKLRVVPRSNATPTPVSDTRDRLQARHREALASSTEPSQANYQELQTVASAMREVPAAHLAAGLRAVLSIGRMRARSWEYYAREVAGGLEDYYAGAGEAPGVWSGRGAAAAGIAGPVSGEALGLAFGEAAHPVSGEALGLGWRVPDGVTGFDATFSAPKSVSVLFALGGPEVRAAVRAAHVAAVEDAGLAYLEDHAALTRRGHDGGMVTDTEGLVIARFEHRTSRAGDPQLHSHCLILNKVRDPVDGRGGPWMAGRCTWRPSRPG